MSQNNNFALVPSAPSSLEKTDPGAKRILSGMAADTLALVKKEQAVKPVISVAMCNYFRDHTLEELIRSVIQLSLPNPSNVELKCLATTTEFINAARQSRFHLFILLLNPVICDHRHNVNACELIPSLKQELDKPVFVISNGATYNSAAELERAGADAIFGMPFGPDEFRSPLQRCLKIPRRDSAKKEPPGKADYSNRIR